MSHSRTSSIECTWTTEGLSITNTSNAYQNNLRWSLWLQLRFWNFLAWWYVWYVNLAEGRITLRQIHHICTWTSTRIDDLLEGFLFVTILTLCRFFSAPEHRNEWNFINVSHEGHDATSIDTDGSLGHNQPLMGDAEALMRYILFLVLPNVCVAYTAVCSLHFQLVTTHVEKLMRIYLSQIPKS